MKTMNVLGVMLVLLFSAVSALGQSRVVLDQSTNAVAFTKDNKSWGLEVNGKEVLTPRYEHVGFQNGLFKAQKGDTWNVCDQTGKFKLSEWVKASGVKMSEKFVVFEGVNGSKEALIYERATWTITKATEISYDDMYNQGVANANPGSRITGYESLAQENRRKYQTQPRVVYKNDKDVLMFRDVEFYASASITILIKDFSEDFWYALVKKDNGNMG
jgi:hypothetical protein